MSSSKTATLPHPTRASKGRHKVAMTTVLPPPRAAVKRRRSPVAGASAGGSELPKAVRGLSPAPGEVAAPCSSVSSIGSFPSFGSPPDMHAKTFPEEHFGLQHSHPQQNQQQQFALMCYLNSMRYLSLGIPPNGSTPLPPPPPAPRAGSSPSHQHTSPLEPPISSSDEQDGQSESDTAASAMNSSGGAGQLGPRPASGASQRTRRNYKNMTRERRIEANARERTRVHTIGAAFETLRQTVPAYSNNQKLSKLAILRIACSYILSLSRLADLDYSADHSKPEFSECIGQLTQTIQTEGKMRRS